MPHARYCWPTGKLLGEMVERYGPAVEADASLRNRQALECAEENHLVGIFGGAEGGRTPDLLIANEALSQLSYGPA